MCGIAGWVSFDSDLTRRGDTLDAMTGTMACRGPDGRGTYLRTHVGLGHRRLAVIDLAGGAQPMSVSTPAGEVAVVYSGETYNFQELRDLLASQGHTFRTESDTEVVLHAYLEWGESLVDHLEGMYAFAIWDEREEKLVLVRDRMGIKPLFYHPTPGGVLFGSEPKAILANPAVRPVVDTDGLRELFAQTKTPAGRSTGACTTCCRARSSPWTAAACGSGRTGACVRPSTPTAATRPSAGRGRCSPGSSDGS